MQARCGFRTVKFTTKEKCVEGVHRTPLELMFHHQHNFSSPLCSALSGKKKDLYSWSSAFFVCVIFVLFCENGRFFSFPNIPNDFLLKCKIMPKSF